MNKRCYNIKEIISISILVGLFLIIPFSVTKEKNSSMASEEMTPNIKQTKIINTENNFSCKGDCTIYYII